jgi:hypothetical protein
MYLPTMKSMYLPAMEAMHHIVGDHKDRPYDFDARH